MHRRDFKDFDNDKKGGLGQTEAQFSAGYLSEPHPSLSVAQSASCGAMMLFTPLVKISRFTNDTSGLQKSLKFLQSLFQVVAAYSVSATDAKPWLQARNQLALGRKYLRFFKFVDAFGLAYGSMTASSGVLAFLETGKWSCLGMYLLLECFTIMDAMGIWSTEWAGMLFVEAMKFWFYSLTFSILLNLVLLYPTMSKSAGAVDETGTSGEKSLKEVDAAAKRDSALRWNLLKKLMIDCCDIYIPGGMAGWLMASSGTIGALGMLSTLLASKDIWNRVQRPS